MIFNNKRGQASEEWGAQQEIVYVLISMILLILGLLNAQKIATDIDQNVEFETKDLAHGLLSARMLNSATCLAYEETLAGKTQVRAGIIDTAKLRDGKARIGKCTDDKIDFLVKVYDANGNTKATIGKSDLPDKKKVIVDTFMVKLFEAGQLSDGRAEIWIKGKGW